MGREPQGALLLFHPPVRQWFERTFAAPTAAQLEGWPALHAGKHTLILAPTGSGKTLAAFLHGLDRLMFSPRPERTKRCRVLYVSPLKALAVDVERNLRQPLAGISAAAAAMGEPFVIPEVALRTGDTPQSERARFRRDPTDILITTPESLYLMLTSNVREVLRSVDTVIVDEIHALVPTKRGAHLALSLERLEALTGREVQRIGLSATQRPLDEVARFLGGVKRPSRAKPPSTRAPEVEIRDEFSAATRVAFRPVHIVDAGARKQLSLSIEVPVEDLARIDVAPDPGMPEVPRTSIWSAIHPRLVELIRQHSSTLIFVNARRSAERLAGALNDIAGEALVKAHHGSIAREQRFEIEENLKAGVLRGLVATSSLELGIDMGSIDLVIQIEAPPSVANGLQRIGRAGHGVGQASEGILFPKYRADLVACAALARAMVDGQVEATRYPRNPLDVLAQQIVAMCALDTWKVDALFETVRRAAPFAELSRNIFEGVLDMLAGRYESDAFADLKPRLTWDRIEGTVVAREGARRVAVANPGTIPDRGLYGVFLASADGKPGARVGELDEEMVFECKVGENFILGASTWRIEEIRFDRVLVSPAAGQPGRMPFWHGDLTTRPLEVGQRIGAMVRELGEVPAAAAMDRLVRHHALQPQAAENLLRYLADQKAATGAVPDDRTLVIERCRDELGDWRICVLSPLGGQVHAPWAMAVEARIHARLGVEAESLWTNDGFVVRLPASDSPPETSLFLPGPDEIESLVMDALGGTALFAARFREIAGRALLLPRRRPGGRAPLWQQRKRASDLLAVASQHVSFPMLLEAYRECLRDVFDLPALQATLRDISGGSIRVHTADSQRPSPFASALLFGFVANYIYEGDAPPAERRAQALAIDPAQLRELMGESELRELVDERSLRELEAELQNLDPRFHARNADALHDLLLRVGDLSEPEVLSRAPEGSGWLRELVRARRVVPVIVAREPRFIAVEDSARYRDALGVVLPEGLPASLLAPVAEPLGDLVGRFSRTHGPFELEELSRRFELGSAAIEPEIRRRIDRGQLVEGAFRPRGTGVEFCALEVLQKLRRRSLAKLRAEIEPVEPKVLARFLASWQGLIHKRRGPDALLDTVEQLQGLALPASLLEREILPARVEGYLPGDLDALVGAGEIVWLGAGSLGDRDGRVVLFLANALSKLAPPPGFTGATTELSAVEQAVMDELGERGASFFAQLHQSLGGFQGQLLDALWSLVWKGRITNDGFRALRAYSEPPERADRRSRLAARAGHARRSAPPHAEGRWSIVASRTGVRPSPTEWSAAVAGQLLARYGVVTREVAQAEGIPGGFSAVYEVLQALEDAGKIRRGYFVSSVGAAQFALPPVLGQLRARRAEPLEVEALLLAATDPANPYGALLPWPEHSGARGLTRSVGANVVVVNGALAAFVGKGARQLRLFLPDAEPERGQFVNAVAGKLAELARRGAWRREGLLIEEIDGRPARDHPVALAFEALGFNATSRGLQLRRTHPL